MKVNSVCFKGLKIGRLRADEIVNLPSISILEKKAESVDITLKHSVKEFPYQKSMMEVPAIKISVRPKNLNFFQRLFSKKVVTEYFPVGNLRKLIKYEKSFEEVLESAIKTFSSKFGKI